MEATGDEELGGIPRLARVGQGVSTKAAHLYFSIRPAGRGAPRIDPKPILDGWKLLESTAIYRAADQDPFGGSEATIGQVLWDDLNRRLGRAGLPRHPYEGPLAYAARAAERWPQFAIAFAAIA